MAISEMTQEEVKKFSRQCDLLELHALKDMMLDLEESAIWFTFLVLVQSRYLSSPDRLSHHQITQRGNPVRGLIGSGSLSPLRNIFKASIAMLFNPGPRRVNPG